MIVIEEKVGETIASEQRRTHLKLSLAERRRQLAQQADKLLEHYKNEESERVAWQGGDIVEF